MIIGISPEVTMKIARRLTAKSESAVSSVFSWNEMKVEERRRRGGKIRLGFISPYFNGDGQSFQLLHFFRFFDKEIFQLICFSSFRPSDSVGERMEARLKEHVDEWYYLDEFTDNEGGHFVYMHQIDILFDMIGHMHLSRFSFFFSHPAPIRVSFLGTPLTTGANCIDYFVGDYFSTPPHMKDVQKHTEKLIFMPNSYQVCEHKYEYTKLLDINTFGLVNDNISKDMPLEEQEELRVLANSSTFPRFEFKRKSKPFVFCNFNHASRIDRDAWSVWMQILDKVPNSVLWIMADPEGTKRNFKRFAREHLKVSWVLWVT